MVGFVILDFGLCGVDFSTDGRWCYIVLWVVPHHSSLKVDWESLKDRLSSACPPSCFFSFYLNQVSNVPTPPPVYLLKFWCHDQRGSLHGEDHNFLITCSWVFLFSLNFYALYV